MSGVFSGNWDKAWSGVEKTFEGVWQSFSTTAKGPINLVIGMVNGLLGGIQTMQNGIAGALNSLSIDLPGWLQDLTGYSSFGFNIGYWTAPNIPYLAKGGLVTAPTFLHAGEMSRPEAVLPLTDHRAMSEIAESIYSNAPAGGGLDKGELVDAIVEGVVMAMMNNSRNMGGAPEYIQNRIYLDRDLMARSVSVANNEMDYRMGATPGFSY